MVIIRKPSQSFSSISDAFYGKNLDLLDVNSLLIRNPSLKLGIRLASKSLTESFENKRDNENQQINSFYKYFLRSTLRSTPFGVFSSVGILDTSKGSSSGNLNKKRFYVRENMYWLSKVISELEKDSNILFGMKVQININISSKPKLLRNTFKNNFKNQRFEKVDIILNESLDTFLSQIGSEPIDVSQLFEKSKKYFCLSKSEFMNLLNYLLTNDFVYSELRTCLNTGTSQINRILTLLSNNLDNNIVSKLTNIGEIIEDINNNYSRFESISTELVDIIDNLEKEMSRVSKSEEYIEFLLIEDNPYVNLKHNKVVSEQLEDFYDFLYRTSMSLLRTCGNRQSTSFKKFFLEKYGYERECILTDLFADNDESLFSISSIIESEENFLSKLEGKMVLSLVNMLNENNEIDLSNYNHLKKFKDLIGNNETIINDFNLSETNEIFCTHVSSQLVTPFDDIINLSPIVSVKETGKTIGRFFDGLNTQSKELVKKQITDYCLRQSIGGEECVSLNINLPIEKIDNLLCNRFFTKSVLPINFFIDNKDISKCLNLNEILLGMDRKNNIYFKNRENGKRIRFIGFNNLNNYLCGDIYHFLVKQSERFSPALFLEILNRALSHFSRRPRVKFNNISIFPKSIKVGNDFSKDQLYNAIESSFSSGFFYIVDKDNRILINWSNMQNRNMFFIELARKKSLLLTEPEEKLDFLLKQGSDDIEIREMVYTLHSTMKICNEVPDDSADKYQIVDTKLRVFPPFSYWTQINAYLPHNVQRVFLNSFFNENVILDHTNQFFFIRYADESGQHIRFRFKYVDNERIMNIIQWFNKLVYKKKISRYSVETYTREIERYGNIETIESVEKIFFYQSMISLELLSSRSDKDIDIEIIFEIVSMINQFSDIDPFNLFNISTETIKHFSSSYRVKKKKIEHRIFKDGRPRFDSNWHSKLMLESRSLSEKLIEQNVTSDRVTNIVTSLVHMFFNRLYGIDREKETKSTVYLYNILRAQFYFEKRGETKQ